MNHNLLVRYIGALDILAERECNRKRRRNISRLKRDIGHLLSAKRLIDEEDALIEAGKRPPLPPVLLSPSEDMRRNP